MPLAWKLLFAAVAELGYALLTRAWMPEQFDGIALELWVTGARAATAALYWWLFRDLIWSRAPRAGNARRPLCIAAIAVVMLAPVLAGDWAVGDLATQVVFALTSVVVGLREELLYRGVVQNLLEPRLGWVGAIVVSNVIFTLYHYGAWPFTFLNLLEFFTVGCLVGLLYWGSGSLWLVVAFHAAYDAVWSFTPLLPAPLSQAWGAVLQVAALLLAALWAARLAAGARGPTSSG
ncbi:MAG TPA: CPBP family intramembrane glutamic endopeptidase [Gammaproteobacteria bacterium]